MEAGLICHPTAGQCVQCAVGMTSTCDAVGFCDFGTGACVGPSPDVCSPCDRTSDCPSGFQCDDRSEEAAGEKVCLQPCPELSDAGVCPQGLACSDRGLCEPTTSSCTNFRLGRSSATCSEDRDCFALAAFPDGVTAGACLPGVMEEMRPSRCRIPCEARDAGPVCPSGFMCADGFCEPTP